MVKIIIEIVKFKLRFERGQAWISHFNPIIFLFGITNTFFMGRHLLSLSVSYLFGCWFIGYIDQAWGIWRHENSYGTLELNPAMEQIYLNTKKKDK